MYLVDDVSETVVWGEDLLVRTSVVLPFFCSLSWLVLEGSGGRRR